MTQHLYIFTAYGTGHPHYKDVTGRVFDYHDEGEFLLIEIGQERSQLQGVLSRLGRSTSSVAVHRSFAFGEPGRFAYQVSVMFIAFFSQRRAVAAAMQMEKYTLTDLQLYMIEKCIMWVGTYLGKGNWCYTSKNTMNIILHPKPSL